MAAGDLPNTPVTITLGIHDDAGMAAHGGDPVLTVADVASFHEFGLGVPQRSFLRGWYDESQAEIAEVLRGRLKGVALGKLTLDQALEQAALALEASVKRRIVKRIPPPLAASTIAAKGSSTPLIDTGQLRAAIRVRVRRG